MPHPPRAILFDMDGTLTEPLLDFAAIRRDIGLPADVGILEAMTTLSTVEREHAEAILHRHETAAAERATLNPGCRELLDWIAARRLPTAVITRNSRACLSMVFELHNLHFDCTITREDAVHKPDPAPLRLACERLGVACEQAWMVGDGHYDIAAGHAAGCPTVWLSHGRLRMIDPPPWQTVADLPALLNLLRKNVSEG